MKIKRYENLVTEVAKRKPKTILEIGTWKAKNAVKMINEAKKHNNDIKYYGFDIFDMNKEMRLHEFHSKQNANYNQAKSNIESTGVEHKIIMGNTLETLENFEPDREIDFVFIDGGHSLETIESDWNNVRRFMNKDTVVIFDDYYENREDYGCKCLIDSLLVVSYGKFYIEKLKPFDLIESKNLKIQLIKVTNNDRDS